MRTTCGIGNNSAMSIVWRIEMHLVAICHARSGDGVGKKVPKTVVC